MQHIISCAKLMARIGEKEKQKTKEEKKIEKNKKNRKKIKSEQLVTK